MTKPLILGAVAYDPKVVTIWDGFKAWFARQGLAFDYVLYSNYESQVRAHFAGHCDVAWNSPLAWIEAERLAAKHQRRARAIAMRDTDMDLTSVVVTHKDAGADAIADLEGKRVGTGAVDSPQATLIPLQMLAERGLTPGEDFEIVNFNIGVGLHGDHVGGERDAARALMAGDVDACLILDANRLLFAREGTLPATSTQVIGETEAFDHCNFTIFEDDMSDTIERFVELLLGMQWDDPEVRPLLELEGLTKWMPGRVSGYGILNRAVDRTGHLDAFLDS